MSISFLKTHKFSLLLLLSGIAFYWAFAYDLQRWDFVKLISLYAALFFVSYKLIQFHKSNFWFLAGIALLFRLVFLFAVPNLSQDFYRFIWDGQLILEGINPYLSTPLSTTLEVTIKNPSTALGMTLTEGMGSLSAGNFTNYPPISQFCYAIAAWLGGKSILGNILVMRMLLIAADFGTLWFGRKLLQKFKLPEHRIFWYVLNPFIIIELTGNLHFEGMMLFFFIWGMYLFFNKKWIWAAVLIGLSVSVKLLPLLFLPLFVKWFFNNKSTVLKKLHNFSPLGGNAEGKRGFCENVSFWQEGFPFSKLILFYVVIMGTVFLSFLPFLSDEFFQNFISSLALWFQKFEFNASFYYLIRWMGFQTVGWNIIGTVGKILPVIVLCFVLGLAFFRKNPRWLSGPERLFTAMLFAVCAYFFLSTTVHPWYLATPLLFSVFTKYRFVLVWSFVVFFSYSAYGKTGFDENLWLVALEYLVVFGILLKELFWKEKSFRVSS